MRGTRACIPRKSPKVSSNSCAQRDGPESPRESGPSPHLTLSPRQLYNCAATVGLAYPPAHSSVDQRPGLSEATFPHAPVAQLDRASDYGSEGYRFKSCRAHHLLPGLHLRHTVPPSPCRLKLLRTEASLHVMDGHRARNRCVISRTGLGKDKNRSDTAKKDLPVTQAQGLSTSQQRESRRGMQRSVGRKPADWIVLRYHEDSGCDAAGRTRIRPGSTVTIAPDCSSAP